MTPTTQEFLFKRVCRSLHPSVNHTHFYFWELQVKICQRRIKTASGVWTLNTFDSFSCNSLAHCRDHPLRIRWSTHEKTSWRKMNEWERNVNLTHVTDSRHRGSECLSGYRILRKKRLPPLLEIIAYRLQSNKMGDYEKTSPYTRQPLLRAVRGSNELGRGCNELDRHRDF